MAVRKNDSQYILSIVFIIEEELALRRFFVHGFSDEPNDDAKQGDSSADHPAGLGAPLIDPLQENKIHFEEVQYNRQDADDNDVEAEHFHDS
jgi:hypothetical protein